MAGLNTGVWGAVAVAASTVIANGAYAACGADEASCEVSSGTYEIILPDDAATAGPAIVFLHGAGGTGERVLKNIGMVDALTARGYAVIAPNGVPRSANRGPSWSFYPGWEGRDEVAYFKELLDDASTRFNIDPQQTVMAGFSAGAFMVNYLACEAPDTFAAYAPVAGGFWRPQPASCEGPIRLHHTHGWTDSVVPLEGRYLRSGTWQQGDIYAGLEVWRDALGCETHAPSRAWTNGDNLLRLWDCGAGAEITFTIHPGGHSVPSGWAEAVTTWFEKAEPSQ
ncbi:prolyl oligopeptidase family serine peptidase [Epibacterium ulvae]|nr:prolyl oligopeptidase family serine peptidase [Epibacterium ulvae]